jgi:dephospho-CoA kinase
MYNERIVIGLVGETGSGKDTVAHYLKRRYNVDLLRFGMPLKKTLDLFFEQSSKEDQAWLYSMFKERFGEDVLHKGVLRYVHQHSGIMCVNGMRMMMDLEFIRSFENNYIMYVTADQELRWKRVTSRGEKTDDDQTLEEFQEFEKTSETEKAIPSIGKEADFTIRNDSTMDDLLWQVDDAMKKILKKRCN